MSPALLTKTLDDELVVLLAGESDECLACGEAVKREDGLVECAGCGSRLEDSPDLALQLRLQAG